MDAFWGNFVLAFLFSCLFLFIPLSFISVIFYFFFSLPFFFFFFFYTYHCLCRTYAYLLSLTAHCCLVLCWHHVGISFGESWLYGEMGGRGVDTGVRTEWEPGYVGTLKREFLVYLLMLVYKEERDWFFYIYKINPCVSIRTCLPPLP